MTETTKLIFKYFPDLSKVKIEQFDALLNIYQGWNEKVNLISRKDMDHFYERHVLHSLSIARFIEFKEEDEVLDIGTGGGFPGIPLAILFPETRFTLVDSIGKKIKIVDAVVGTLELKNVKTINARVETLNQKFDFIVSRATAPMAELIKWSIPLLRKRSGSGLLALKGGDLSSELQSISQRLQVKEISTYFEEEFFETKKIVFLPS